MYWLATLGGGGGGCVSAGYTRGRGWGAVYQLTTLGGGGGGLCIGWSH